LAGLLKYQPCDEPGPKVFLPHMAAISATPSPTATS
jgi:hypothetical protein